MNQNCSKATNKLNSTLLKRAQEVALDFWMVLFKNRVEIEPDLGNICARKTSARYQRGESGGQCYSLQKCIFVSLGPLKNCLLLISVPKMLLQLVIEKKVGSRQRSSIIFNLSFPLVHLFLRFWWIASKLYLELD